MFKNRKYITSGVYNYIPPLLQTTLWGLIKNMPVDKDYLQVFLLSSDNGKQKVIHTQEMPEYKKEYVFDMKPVVTGTVFAIDDKTHSTMLMNYEY